MVALSENVLIAPVYTVICGGPLENENNFKAVHSFIESCYSPNYTSLWAAQGAGQNKESWNDSSSAKLIPLPIAGVNEDHTSRVNKMFGTFTANNAKAWR